MTQLVYDFNGQSPAAGRREVWIDHDTGEWFLLTGDKDGPDGVKQTKRKLRVKDASPNNPPVAVDIEIEGTING